MNTANVRAVLRIVAVLTMFAAAIGVSTTVLGNWSLNRFLETGAPGAEMHIAVNNFSGYAILTWLVLSLWGLILYVLSSAIARHITSDPDLVTADADVPSRGEVARG